MLRYHKLFQVVHPYLLQSSLALHVGDSRKYPVLPAVENAAFSTSFSHIFSGGYSAGYYSYKWAEVLEADAFSLFKEKGIFNQDAADSFRELLTKGDSIDPAVLYRNFRGHDPEPEALLKQLKIES